MTKNDRIYRIVSIFSFIVHICLFVFVLIVGFLPYRTSQNFYECIVGFYGTTGLAAFSPYILMLILLLACLFAFLAVNNRPILLFWAAALSLTFFVGALLPYLFEAAFVGFVSPWINGSMSEYGIGFKLLSGASYIIYFDIAVLAYLIIGLVVKIINGVPKGYKNI